jgi:hypothetical protein
MKIGPLPLDRGSAHAYVAFGEGGLDVVVEGSDDKGLAALRRKCGQEPLVCERALAQVAAAQGLKVAELPPQVRAIKAALAVSLEHGPTLETVGPELILELIDAAVAFEAAEPWNVFEPDEPLSIRIDSTGRELEGCVLGTGGEEFGLALYHQAGSIDRVHTFVDEGRPEAARSLACTTMLLAYDNSCSVEAVRAMIGVEVAPLVFHITGGGPRAAGPDDVAVLVAGLRAATALAEGRAPRGETRDPAHQVVAHAARANMAEPRAMLYAGVGRNQSCPCGSGKKFKRCHLGAVETAPSPAPGSPRAMLHARDERLAADIIEHGKRRFGGETLVRRLSETLGDRASSGQFVTPWLAYMLPFEGEPLAAHFLLSRGSSLSTEDRQWIERQLATPVGIWEILRVDHGRGVDAVDLLTGTRCFVHEAMGSGMLAPRDAILARAVADEVVVFCGVHETPLDPTNAEAVVARFGEAASKDGAAQRLIDLWEGQVAETRRKAATPVKITNTDGHEAATVEDRFALHGGSFEAAFARLAALDGVNVDERDRAGARFTFTRAGNAKHAHWANTIIGSARLTPTRLVVQTNSSERAEVLMARLCDVLGDLATWKKRTRETLPEILGGETVMIDGQLVTSPAQTTLRDAYRAWLDLPVPSLGGRTPREAAHDAEGRRGVHLMLKQQENHHARKPVEGLDPAQLRRELGLDELGQPLPNLELARAVGSGRKLSETMIDFARPMLDAEGAQIDEHHMRAVLGFAIAVWNAVVAAAHAGKSLDAATIRADLPAHRWTTWLEPLLARKHERFGDDLRLVGDWYVRRHRDRLDIQIETRVSPMLHAQLEAAGVL